MYLRRSLTKGEVQSATLFLVSTPIGNLDDITLRALKILKEVDFILAEDTRNAAKLLNHFQIQNKIFSYYSYNEAKRIPTVIEQLKMGQNGALISDAGTPLISDPGFKLVAECVKENINIVPVPGASAVLTALSASGLLTDRFIFEGFLPRKKGRKTKLEFLAAETGTIIIYEAAVRLRKTLEDIDNILGNRYIVVARELTKKFEEFIRGDIHSVLEILKNRPPKGEIVLMIAGTAFKENINRKDGNL